jgi:two-component system, NarL family, sensor kinase
MKECASSGKQNKGLSSLMTIAAALNRSVSLDAALETTLAQVAALFGLETGWIWLQEEKSGQSYLAAARNLPPALRNNPVAMTGSCYCLDSYHAGDMDGAANINIITCSRLKRLVDGTDNLRHHASVPLYARDGQQLGILNVASQDWRQLSSDELELLHTVGDLLSIAVERARLFDHSVQLGAVEERNRLAREIHDTLAQNLSGVTLQLETLDALLDAGADTARLKPIVARVLDLTRAGLEDARRSVLDLRAAPLEGRGLSEALQSLAQDYADRYGLRILFDAVGATRPLPARMEVGIYRIAQESLTNAVNHAQAHLIHVELTITPERVALTVHDDGCGFDPDQIEDSGRFGLKGIQERAKLLGGHMHLETHAQVGTTLRVVIPLES